MQVSSIEQLRVDQYLDWPHRIEPRTELSFFVFFFSIFFFVFFFVAAPLIWDRKFWRDLNPFDLNKRLRASLGRLSRLAMILLLLLPPRHESKTEESSRD